jgi:hypothetical protein
VITRYNVNEYTTKGTAMHTAHTYKRLNIADVSNHKTCFMNCIICKTLPVEEELVTHFHTKNKTKECSHTVLYQEAYIFPILHWHAVPISI